MKSLSLYERLSKPQDKVKQPEFSEQKNLSNSDLPEEDLQDDTGVVASAFGGKHSAEILNNDDLQDLKWAIHRRIVDEMTPDEEVLLLQGESAREQIKNIISAYSAREMADNFYNLSRIERAKLIEDICNELLGLGPLEPLLQNDRITEIMVNGAKKIFIEQEGKLKRTNVYFHDERHLMSIIERIVAPLGRHVDESSPLVDARLADGSRVNIIIPPLSLAGPSITIRKFSKRAMTM